MFREILSIKDLNVNYIAGNEDFKILKNVDFTLFKNEILGIVGESGSGKTTLSKCLMGVLDREETRISFNQYVIGSVEIDSSFENIKKLRGCFINMVMQNPVLSLNPTMTIEDHFRIVLKDVSGIKIRGEQNYLINNILKDVTIEDCSDILKKYPMELSVGMNQRINIALSIINNPKILILDEPTSSVDENNRQKILDTVGILARKNFTSVVLITHDLLSAIKFCNRIIVMKDGLIVDSFHSNQNKFVHSYTRKLYKNSLLKRNIIKNTGGDVLIEMDNVCKSFANVKVLDNFSMRLMKGETLGIIGPSGSGKTTISKLILGFYKPSSGVIRIKKFLKIEIIFQNANSSLNHNQKIFKILNEENYINNKKKYSDDLLFSLLKDFNLPKNILEKYVAELSEGQKQIISIIRGLLNNPDVIIFDEPTSSLDTISQKKILDLLIKVKNKYNLTYIFISHNQRVIRYMCDRNIFI
jgi:ABC-type glutathione transport system ATPase component